MDILKEIESDKVHYKQALDCIMRKHQETDGNFCNGFISKTAKEYGVKVTPLKELYRTKKQWQKLVERNK